MPCIDGGRLITLAPGEEKRWTVIFEGSHGFPDGDDFDE